MAVNKEYQAILDSLDDVILERYPAEGSKPISQELGVPESTIRHRAAKIGVKLSKETALRIRSHAAKKAAKTRRKTFIRTGKINYGGPDIPHWGFIGTARLFKGNKTRWISSTEA